MKVANSINELIGGTPVVKLNRMVDENSAEVYAKLEFFNPGGSVKDRISLAMVEVAEQAGILKMGDTIIEPTSGNTGIGLAMVAAAKGYKMILTMPENMSIERRNTMRAYGVKVILTPEAEGMAGAIDKANKLCEEHGYFMPQQFDNFANPEAHRLTTGQEVLEQFPDGVDAFVAGVGTGGTITGVGEVLKEKFPNTKVIAVEPKDSPVLSGGEKGSHPIQGIGAGFLPDVLNQDVYDEIFQATGEDSFATARAVAQQEGILVGISSGAAIYAALETAKKLGKGKKVLVLVADNGERYLSTPLFRKIVCSH